MQIYYKSAPKNTNVMVASTVKKKSKYKTPTQPQLSKQIESENLFIIHQNQTLQTSYQPHNNTWTHGQMDTSTHGLKQNNQPRKIIKTYRFHKLPS